MQYPEVLLMVIKYLSIILLLIRTQLAKFMLLIGMDGKTGGGGLLKRNWIVMIFIK